jgi:hypothetical protein
MKTLILNQEAKIIIKFSSEIGDFVQRVKVSDLSFFKNDFGIDFALYALTINEDKWEWVDILSFNTDEEMVMCSRQLHNGGYWIQVPHYLGRYVSIFNGLSDPFPYTSDTMNDYLYLISSAVGNLDRTYDIVYNESSTHNSIYHNFSKNRMIKIMKGRKSIDGFLFKKADETFYFDYKNFDTENFLQRLFDDFGNMPLSNIEEILLFNSGFLSQFALMRQQIVKSDFIIPELLWIYQLMYKKEVDLHIPHSDSTWKGITRNQKVSQLALAYYKKNLIKMDKFQMGYAIEIDSMNKLLVNVGYFLIEV